MSNGIRQGLKQRRLHLAYKIVIVGANVSHYMDSAVYGGLAQMFLHPSDFILPSHRISFEKQVSGGAFLGGF